MNLDWQRIMLNIRASGLSATAVAKKVGMDPTTAQRIARGERKEDPLFGQGIALLDLHHSLCPEKHKLEELRR